MAANYIDFVMQTASDKRTEETPFNLLGGYVSSANWVRAKTIVFDELEKERTTGFVRAYAKDVVRALRRNPALNECAGDLRQRAEQLAGLSVHGNSDPRPRTLHHASGTSATGTRKELARLTGLSYDRVRDLLTGRRRYALGWSASAAEARKGPAASGRPRKTAPPPPVAEAPEPEFFQADETSFF